MKKKALKEVGEAIKKRKATKRKAMRKKLKK